MKSILYLRRREAYGKIFTQAATTKLGWKTICWFKWHTSEEEKPICWFENLVAIMTTATVSHWTMASLLSVYIASLTLCCTWFRDWVLTGALALHAEIIKPKWLKRCAECDSLFLAKSNRAKYCSGCARKIHRRQGTASDRKRRSNTNK